MKRPSIIPIILTLSAALLFPLSCSDDSDRQQPAQILVTVSNECLCNVFLYTPTGLCLQSKIWDCQSTKLLIFEVFYEGTLSVQAAINEKSATQTITAHYGKTSAVDIIL